MVRNGDARLAAALSAAFPPETESSDKGRGG